MDGIIFVAFVFAILFPSLIYSVIRMGVKVYLTPIRLTYDSPCSQAPRAAVGFKGDNHIVWWDTRDDPIGSIWKYGEIYYTKLTDTPKFLYEDESYEKIRWG